MKQVARDIAKRLNDLKSATKMTHRQIGHLAGRGVNAVSEWMLGKRRPPMTALAALARRLQLPESVFEGGPMPSEVIAGIPGWRPPVSSDRVSEGRIEYADSPDASDDAEDRFRTYVRQIDRTHRMMVGDPAEVNTGVIRELQLKAVELAEKQCELGGRPIPGYMRSIRNELIAGTFR